jgi:hypothetical protein
MDHAPILSRWRPAVHSARARGIAVVDPHVTFRRDRIYPSITGGEVT